VDVLRHVLVVMAIKKVDDRNPKEPVITISNAIGNLDVLRDHITLRKVFHVVI